MWCVIDHADTLSHSMNDILEPGLDYLTYQHGNSHDLVQKITWVTSHGLESEQMARRAHTKICAGHMEYNRALRVVGWFTKSEKNKTRDLSKIKYHLARACDHVSQLNFPVEVTSFFAQRAAGYAGEARVHESGRDWSLLILANSALENDDCSAANGLLLQISDDQMEPEFKLRYLKLKILIEALSGRLQEASDILTRALEDYPGDFELRRIEKALLTGGQ